MGLLPDFDDPGAPRGASLPDRGTGLAARAAGTETAGSRGRIGVVPRMEIHYDESLGFVSDRILGLVLLGRNDDRFPADVGRSDRLLKFRNTLNSRVPTQRRG